MKFTFPLFLFGERRSSARPIRYSKGDFSLPLPPFSLLTDDEVKKSGGRRRRRRGLLKMIDQVIQFSFPSAAKEEWRKEEEEWVRRSDYDEEEGGSM